MLCNIFTEVDANWTICILLSLGTWQAEMKIHNEEPCFLDSKISLPDRSNQRTSNVWTFRSIISSTWLWPSGLLLSISLPSVSNTMKIPTKDPIIKTKIIKCSSASGVTGHYNSDHRKQNNFGVCNWMEVNFDVY